MFCFYRAARLRRFLCFDFFNRRMRGKIDLQPQIRPQRLKVADIEKTISYLDSEFQLGSEDYNQGSRGFCPSKRSNLLRVHN